MTHDLAEWKDEIAWMSLYFSAAVWASLALCVCYSLEDHLPRYRTEPAVASWSADVQTAVGNPHPAGNSVEGGYLQTASGRSNQSEETVRFY